MYHIMGVCFDSGIDSVPCSSAQSFIWRAHQRALRCRVFFQEKLMHLSYHQTDEPFIFLNLRIWVLGIFNAALASQTLIFCPYMPLSCQTLKHPQFLSKFHSPKWVKIQIYRFRKIKGSYFFGYNKCISTFYKKAAFICTTP